MEETNDIACWKALRDTSAQWSTLIKTADTPHAALQARSHTLPPQLRLQKHIANVRCDLQELGLDTEIAERCASAFEQSLRSASDEFQRGFEEAWIAVGTDPVVADTAQSALVKLHEDGFKSEVACRKAIMISSIKDQHLERLTSASDSTLSGNWTEATRALMERVYQEHPKLEAHEKRLLAEASGLSLRQISIWFANQRQRKGWPLKQEDRIEEEDEQEQPSTPVKSSHLSASTSSLHFTPSSSIERCPSPLTPASLTSACPSLSSSTFSRSSSDSWIISPTRAQFQFGSPSLLESQAPTFDFSQPVIPPPSFDIDQLLRQLTPSQPITPEASYNGITTCIPTFIPTPPNESAKGPFAFKSENEHATMSTKTTPPSTMESFQWLPINMQGLLPQEDTTLSKAQPIEDFTPQANQLTFAPLQLDTSQYLQQSPSANVDLSSVVDSFSTNDFWSTFMSEQNLPAMPSWSPEPARKRQRSNDGVTIAQPEANWSDIFLKDLDTWGKPPQLAQPQLQF